MLKDFYDLHRDCVNHEEDFESECDKKILPQYPAMQKFYVDNDYFATSNIYVLPLSDKLVALCYVDQFSKEIVRLNFSPGRLSLLVRGLGEVLSRLKD
jgi:hypothetical protein